MIEPARLLLIFWVTLAMACVVQARDYLRDDVRDNEQYHLAIRRVMSQGWRKDVVLRTLLIPAFSKEVAVGIRRDNPGYRTFAIEPTSQIWLDVSPENKDPNYSRVRSTCFERPLRSDIAESCVKLWYKVLSNRDNYRQDEGIIVDATQAYFFVQLAAHKPISAWMRQWDENAQGRVLLDTSARLIDYIDGKLTEAKLIHMLQLAEGRIDWHHRGSHESSNQKMELTTSGLYNLPFGGLVTYPVAMRALARGSSSCSR
jgi:hypothetical protein